MILRRVSASWLLVLPIVPAFALGPACTRSGPTTPPTVDQTATAETAPSALPDTLDTEALESDARTLKSSVTQVTVYSDRARVTRRASADLTAEPTVHAFRNLPGWVDDGSVRVATDAGRIVDVRVERSFLAEATDATIREAEREHDSLQQKLATLDDEIQVLDAQRAQIESIKAFSLEKITKDTTIGDVSVDTYSDVLTFITDALRSTAASRRKVAIDRAEIQPEFEASQRQLADLQNLLKLEETTVFVTLQGGASAPASLDLTYMLPGATWEPVHELRVSGADSGHVEVISFAQVTQTSGEDWGNAELSFSTQSTTQSTRIPELEALTLGDTYTADRILTSQVSSFTRAMQAFEGQNALWNKVHHGSSGSRSSRSSRSSRASAESFERVYKSNVEYLQIVQGKTVEIFESLQKRGTTAMYHAHAASAVRGDGHPVRMRIGQATLDATSSIVAAPEQSLNAALTLQLANATGQPLLPGNVALYRDGTFLGMTEMEFVADEEAFSLFLGVADHVKIARRLDRKRSSIVRKRRTRMEVAFIVTVENLGDAPTKLSLADRIPVSESRDIRVERVKLAPSVSPDSRGIVSWDVALKPKESKQFRISYQVDYPSELVIEARRRRASQPKPAPGMRKAYEIDEQLADIEDAL